MAKKRRENPWYGPHREEQLDGMFSAMRDEAGKRLGRDDISLGTESEHMLVGIPFPALCLRYLFQSTVFPLSRILQITGEEGSCKSSLLYEMFRWHMVYGGGAVFLENENKDSPELRNSILKWNPAWIRRTEVLPTYSLEEWQNGLTKFLEIATETQDAAEGPGHTIPIIFGIDSIMATGPEEELRKIQKEGHATRNFALAAYLISQYMRSLPRQIKTYPFTIVGTNHLKPSTDFMGRPTSTTPGGKSVKFMETYELEMKRAPSPDIDILEYGGLKLKLTCRKNSLGPSRKQIGAELLWWYAEDPATGLVQQRTAWDWDTATIELLLSFALSPGKKTIYNKLMEICHIVVTNKPRREAKCKVLGFNEPVHFRYLGAALEARPDILNQMYPVLGITIRKQFQPGVDYRDVQQQAIVEAAAESASLYENIESLPTPDANVLDPTGSTILPTDSDEEYHDDGVAVRQETRDDGEDS